MTTGAAASRAGWLGAMRRYLLAVTMGNLVWEVAQLPLYTLWRTETFPSLSRAVLHCTAGDIVIATVILVVALAIVGNAGWPDERATVIALTVMASGIVYTIGSEYLNTVVRRSWTYTEWMPTIPWLGTGVAPLAQWLAVPAISFALVRQGAVNNRKVRTPCMI